MPPFWILFGIKDDRSEGGGWQPALQDVQSTSQIVNVTNKAAPGFLQAKMPFLSPNQQCQSTEGEKWHQYINNITRYCLQFFTQI